MAAVGPVGVIGLAVLLSSLVSPLHAYENVPWGGRLPADSAWWASDAARQLVTNILDYQYPSGGWPKNKDMSKPVTPEVRAALEQRDEGATIDNGATHSQIRVLARYHALTGDPGARAGALRGLDYLFAAQYANGGWPQYHPLRKGYYTHITFNDHAMIRVVEVLDDVARGNEPFAWVDEPRRARAVDAVSRAVDCLLACQVVVDGRKTVWCSQHDEHTFAPAPARKFEPVSLTALESAEILRFLMRLPSPSPSVVEAVESGVAWLKAVQLRGIRSEVRRSPELEGGRDRIVIPDPAAPPLWARFYEIGTNRPIFIGRDAAVRYALAEIEHERRVGYAWYSDSPARVVERDYPRWRAQRAAP
jgi:PelA/Pel-15E family pectate lyase